MEEVSAPTVEPPESRSPWAKLGLVLAIVAAVFAAAHFLGVADHLKTFVEKVETLGPWGPIIFIVTYIVATVCLVPASALTLAAGAVFGLAWGTVYVSIASTLGACAAFLVGRYFARGWVNRQIEGSEKFAAIDDAVEDEGWKIVALTRLSPAFPFNLLNYAYGLTKVPLVPYGLASWIAMMPGTVMYVYLGSLAKAPEGRTPGQWALLIVGLLATIAATVMITRSAKRALNKRLDDDSAEPA